MLQLVEVPLDEVAQPIERWCNGAHNTNVALARDVGGGASGRTPFDQRLGAVAAVGHDVRCEWEPVEEDRRCCLVGGLTSRDYEADRQAPLVDDGVEFGRQSSTRTANGVIRAPFFPPAACW